MATLYNDDKFLVNDGTETNTVTFEEIKKGKSSTMLNDSDLFLVNDGTKTETVTWAQMQEDAGTAPVIDSVTLAEDTPETKERFTNQFFTTTYVMAEDGKPASTKSMRAWVEGDLVGTCDTDPIQTVDDTSAAPNVILTFPTDTHISCFEAGDTVQGTELGEFYNLYGNGLNNMALINPVLITDWTQTELGQSTLTGESQILYAQFTTPKKPVFTRIDGGTGSDLPYQNLCYWNGLTWIVDDTTSGGISDSNSLKAKTAATDWAAFRTLEGLNIGDTIFGNINSTEGYAWTVSVFGFSAPNDPIVKVVSTDIDAKTITVDGGDWEGTDGSTSGTEPRDTYLTVYKGHSTKQYLKLDALGSDVFEVKELKSNPDNLEVSLSTYDVDTKTGTAQIKFGATLGVDDVPDDVLPINTSIKTEITALNGIENPDKTNVKESNPVTPISVTGPNATMYGLRFEGQRKTKLYFPNPGTGSRKSTVSMWFKHTKSNDFYALFSQGQDSNNDGFFTRFRIENGKLRVETAQAAGVQQVSMVTPSVIPEERWQHLVVSFDSDSAMIMYLNGQEVGRRALESTGKYPWEAGRDTNIGCLGKNASGDDIQFYEGYLSDVFYVEGQDLPPETFGEDFEGKWGPLDSEVVKTNIGDFGTNGFFLPFNPDESGANYNQYVTIFDYDAVQTPPDRMFDGNTADSINNIFQIRSSYPDFVGWELNYPEGMFSNGVYTLIGAYIDQGEYTATLSDGTEIVSVDLGVDNGGDSTIYDFVVPAGVSLLKISAKNIGTSSCNTKANKWNGEFLINYSAIGYDASGNDNHFTDENFDLINVGVDYVANTTQSGDVSATTDPANIFDGDLSTRVNVAGTSGGSVTYDFNGSLPEGNYRLYATIENLASMTINGTEVLTGFPAGAPYWVPVEANKIDTLQIFFPSAGSYASYLFGIEVNGSLLINNSTLDTVFDTPMENYAVLEDGSNGNLVLDGGQTTGSQIPTLVAPGRTYFEVGISGPGAPSNSSQPAITVAKNATSNPGSLASIKWEGQGYLIDDTNTGAIIPHTINDGDLLGVLSDAEGKNVRFYKNGVEVINESVTGEVVHYLYRFSNSTGWISTINFGQQPFAASNVTHDLDAGTVVVDGETCNTLFQTWAEWNDYAPLFADNPEDVAKFEAIKASLESYEGNLRQYRAELLTRLVAAGFNIREIDSMDLINIEDATAWAINTGYEDAALVTYEGEYWYALSSSYNNSPDDNDPEDWLSMGPVD